MPSIHIDTHAVIQIAQEAAKEIMAIYQSDFSIEHKQDESPLTAADQASHRIINQQLTQLYSQIPVLSEEGSDVPFEQRRNWETFWLVDPLDGTKEFIKRNGEFTVNIALIEKGYPVFGVIVAPVLDAVYYGIEGKGAYVRKISESTEEQPIYVKKTSVETYTIVESRSHPSKELDEYMALIAQRFATVDRIQTGSSLKFCAVAEGKADAYPRFGPTMEWDTAAGQAIVESAGGKVSWTSGERVSYNKSSLRNDFFIVSAE